MWRKDFKATVSYGGYRNLRWPLQDFPSLSFSKTKTFITFNPFVRLTYRLFLRVCNLILHHMELKSDIRLNKFWDFYAFGLLPFYKILTRLCIYQTNIFVRSLFHMNLFNSILSTMLGSNCGFLIYFNPFSLVCLFWPVKGMLLLDYIISPFFIRIPKTQFKQDAYFKTTF